LRPPQRPPARGPGRQRPASAGPAPCGHIPFTPRAKKTLQLSLREAETLHDNYIGVQHLTLALLTPPDGTVPAILSALGAPATSLRAAILARYRKAS
jgi:ATP-dependent Clp protease ATP-binding subunit ClpA